MTTDNAHTERLTPVHQLEPAEVYKATCGCVVNAEGYDLPDLTFCPLHASAPALLDALKACQVRLFMLDGRNAEYILAEAAIEAASG